MESGSFKIIGGDFDAKFLHVNPPLVTVGKSYFSIEDVARVSVLNQEMDVKYNYINGILGVLAYGAVGVFAGSLGNKAVVTSAVAVEFGDGRVAIVECIEKVS